MSTKKWFKGSVHYQGQLTIDDYAALIMNAGAQAVNIIGPDSLDFYLECSSKELEEFQLQIIFRDCSSINIQEVIPENWVQKCGELFDPVICGDLKIIPLVSASDRQIHQDHEALYLIPGMGFGSGHHPTSQMILELIQNLSEQPQTILDCGTGSGILSIAASKIFNASVHAFDNDPQALINAQENFNLNNLNDIKLTLNSVEEIHGQFDLILANLYLELLKQFKNDFLRLLKPQSILILSGITADQAEELKENYQELILIESKTVNNWCAFKFKLKN